MLARPVVMTGMLGAAVGVPYAIHHPPQEWPVWKASASAGTADPRALTGSAPYGAAGPYALSSGAGTQLANGAIYQGPMPPEGGGFYPLEQVLRMDITKDWVYRHWARKSTGLSEPNLFGVRVALVTGTGTADLAGSLTYYFNGAGQVDKIRFHGTTADTTRVIGLAQRSYGLAWQSPRVPGEQLLESRSGDKVVSQLRTYPEPVLWSTRPQGSFGVELELNRPGAGLYVEGPKPVLPPPPPAPPSPPAAEPAEDTAETGLQPVRPPEYRWPD